MGEKGTETANNVWWPMQKPLKMTHPHTKEELAWQHPLFEQAQAQMLTLSVCGVCKCVRF